MGRPRVLIVDDEPVVHDTVARFLRGCELLHAYEGGAADEILDREPVDVVLLDFQLPGRNGLQLLDGWQAKGLGSTVIMLTNNGAIARAHAAGLLGVAVLDKSLESYESLDAQVAGAIARRSN